MMARRVMLAVTARRMDMDMVMTAYSEASRMDMDMDMTAYSEASRGTSYAASVWSRRSPSIHSVVSTRLELACSRVGLGGVGLGGVGWGGVGWGGVGWGGVG